MVVTVVEATPPSTHPAEAGVAVVEGVTLTLAMVTWEVGEVRVTLVTTVLPLIRPDMRQSVSVTDHYNTARLEPILLELTHI